MLTTKKTELVVHTSSGNVFADLGLANSQELLEKAKLAHFICDTLLRRKLTQMEAAAILGVDQAKISKLKNGHIAGFSIERLVRFLVALQQDVTITVKPVTGRRKARLVVAA